jgi:hypothetical protein
VRVLRRGPRGASLGPMRILLALPLLAACQVKTTIESSARATVDPVVVVHGLAGEELGVSTTYGVVFLGRTARSGRVEFTAYFGDGPARETGLVVAMGGGVFATESEIRLPAAPLCFEAPPPGSEVWVRGRRAGQPFEFEARLVTEPRVTGLLLEPSPELDALTDAQLGAGVFLLVPGRPMQLLGLVSGRLTLDERKDYVTVLGPEELWRLVVHQRNAERPRRKVYRPDVL